MQAIPESRQQLQALVDSLEWYHTIDLGNGMITQGHYDHRQFLQHYKLPDDLTGKRVLDIGAASGFFSFEFERRGAQVTATDLPQWFDHDFSPIYNPDKTSQTGDVYLHRPFQVAKQVLGSQVEMKYANLYDITPDKFGTFDLVFCASVLLHLTDPTKALWNIAKVTHDQVIIATVIPRKPSNEAYAEFVGHYGGDTWWLPTRRCLELMAVTAGFVGIEWIGEFDLLSRNRGGAYHGVMHCYKTTQHWTAHTQSKDQILAQTHQNLAIANALQIEIEMLKANLRAYENRRAVKMANWIGTVKKRFIG